MIVRHPQARPACAIRLLSFCLAVLAFAAAHADPGDLDASFGTGGVVVLDATLTGAGTYPDVQNGAALPDGKLVLAGTSVAASGDSTTFVTRLLPSGAPDTSMGTTGAVFVDVLPGIPEDVQAVALQVDGKILVGVSHALAAFSRLIRFNVNGTIDTTFAGTGWVDIPANIEELAIDRNGRIVAGHAFAIIDAFLPNGQRDPSFVGNGHTDFRVNGFSATALAIQYDGKIVVGGHVNATVQGYEGTTVPEFTLSRLNTNGTRDTTFGTNGFARTTVGVGTDIQLTDIALQPDGYIVATGVADDPSRCSGGSCSKSFAVARYRADGVLDATFATGGVGLFAPAPGSSANTTAGATSSDIGVQPDGRIVIGGALTERTPGGFFISRPSVVLRLTSPGAIDSTYGTNGRSLWATAPGNAYLTFTVGHPSRKPVILLPNGTLVHVAEYALTGGSGYVGAIAVARYLTKDANDDGVAEPWDVMPDAFSFVDLPTVPIDSVQTSNLIDVAGLDAGIRVPAFVAGIGAEVSLNASTTYTTGAVWVANGDRLNVRHTAAATANTRRDTLLVVGGFAPAETPLMLLPAPRIDTFSSTTIADPPGTLGFLSSTLTASESVATVPVLVRRIGGSAGAVSVSYLVAGGTATGGADFVAALGTLSWGNGDTANKVINVALVNDSAVEPAETLTVTLSNPLGGAALGTAMATVTIDDDDAVAPANPGQLAFAATTVSVAEGSSTVLLTVQRTGGSDGAVSVAYATSNGTAGASDFTAATGTLSWGNGDTASKPITVALLNDAAHESAETFTVVLSSPTAGATLGAATATVTITDDDAAAAATPGQIAFAAGTANAAENAANVLLMVQRTGGGDGNVTVTWALSAGTAAAGTDYSPASGTLTWLDGDVAAKSISVSLVDDTINESSESFSVVLSSPTGGATLGLATATVLITDDDAAPAGGGGTGTGSGGGSGGGGGGGGATDGLGLVGLLTALCAASLRRRRACAGRDAW